MKPIHVHLEMSGLSTWQYPRLLFTAGGLSPLWRHCLLYLKIPPFVQVQSSAFRKNFNDHIKILLLQKVKNLLCDIRKGYGSQPHIQLNIYLLNNMKKLSTVTLNSN